MNKVAIEQGISFPERKCSDDLSENALGERARVSVNTEDIPNLDFLRACAVLFVVGFHLLLYFRIAIPGPLKFYYIGRWGVLIFFVHTTLVLFFSLERLSRHASAQRLFLSFLIRRAFRILPLSVLVVCLVELLGLPVGHFRNGQFILVHLKLPGLLSNIFLVQNITHAESATAPLWSLPYEMQMYLVLPVLFLLVRAIGVLLPITCLWLAGILAMQHASWFARYNLPDFMLYVPYFLPGIIAYKWMSVSKIRLPAVIWPLVLAGITAIDLYYPSHFIGAVCCLMLGMAIPHFSQLSQIGVVKVTQLVARYSYGIYLTHFICIWLAFQAMSRMTRVEQWVFFLVLLFLIPITLYHLIEAPMIQLGRRLAFKVC